MSKKLDLVGQRFGRLIVTGETDRREMCGAVVWACRCDCGREHAVSTGALRSGRVRSCGCLISEVQKARHAAKRQACADRLLEDADSELRRRNSYLSAEIRRLAEENRQLRARLAGRGYRPRHQGVESC